METEKYMTEALAQAHLALACGDVPVGCVIVQGDRVIARGHNLKEQKQNAILHAEIVAILEACRVLNRWRLDDCTLYVTLEPCPMCAGAILNARIARVVYGARDKNLGACGGVLNLFEEAFGYHPPLQGGVLEQECARLLHEFFSDLRQ